MKHRTTSLLLATVLLTAPGALAHATEAAADAEPPGTYCEGHEDFACWHWDCATNFCIRLFCPVYSAHSSHGNGSDFGCS